MLNGDMMPGSDGSLECLAGAPVVGWCPGVPVGAMGKAKRRVAADEARRRAALAGAEAACRRGASLA